MTENSHFIQFILWLFVLTETASCEYTYFRTNEKLHITIPDGSKLKTGYSNSLKFREPQYKTLEEIFNPPDLMYGRFHGFLDLFKQSLRGRQNRTHVRVMRKALASAIHFLESNTTFCIYNHLCPPTVKGFKDIVCMWKIFFHCLTQYDFREYKNACTQEFLVADPGKAPAVNSTLDWNPNRDVRALPLGEDMLLILFNLGLCQHYHYHYRFICPNLCLGYMHSKSSSVGIPSSIGNPCKKIQNTRTEQCFNRRVWSNYIHDLFADLVDPSMWEILPGEGRTMEWVKQDSGYVCDCDEHYHWIDTTMRCERGREWVDMCQSNKTACDPKGTFRCVTDQRTGAATCECNPGYTGRRCRAKVDACRMQIITFKRLNRKKGRIERMLKSGNEMCNINMSGVPIVITKVKSNVSNEIVNQSIASECIPTLGTTRYRCRCVYPFFEDTSIEIPNCFKRYGPCDHRICVHGSCLSSITDNEFSVCICDPGWDGDLCDHKSEHWSVWSDCLPVCGTNRTRTRRRSAVIRDPRPWVPPIEDIAEMPNYSTDQELMEEHGELTQVEVCPPRTGPQCPYHPSVPVREVNSVIFEFQAVLSLAVTLLLFAVSCAGFGTRVFRGRRVV